MTDQPHAAPTPLSRTPLQALGLDFPGAPNQPSALRILVATIVAVGGSLLACALLAALGVVLFPSTRGYEHYGFSDYGKLTIIGVVVAALAWPIVTRVSSRARLLYFWLAVIVTVVSFAPDAWILYQGQPAGGVFILALMHIALAVITYPALVLIAPPRGAVRATTPRRS
ncbi:DUF6069 family protein [Galbitalea soli]|uniref:Uncharacterized protein n=1 Tax=Galbitalea soli TaxID=1268042 RepID=A0A7C9PPD7_9MICO|nr:DUF6069 family protein [Galbitalea soli]NEM92292.1 hypothetical protein [Galbitalea soli]NYJ31752.1 hypothetical protein [Galbitalea soli]